MKTQRSLLFTVVSLCLLSLPAFAQEKKDAVIPAKDVKPLVEKFLGTSTKIEIPITFVEKMEQNWSSTKFANGKRYINKIELEKPFFALTMRVKIKLEEEKGGVRMSSPDSKRWGGYFEKVKLVDLIAGTSDNSFALTFEEEKYENQKTFTREWKKTGATTYVETRTTTITMADGDGKPTATKVEIKQVFTVDFASKDLFVSFEEFVGGTLAIEGKLRTE